MPRRLSATPVSPRPQPPRAAPSPTTAQPQTARTWTAPTSRRALPEEPFDRWHRLHQPVVEVPERRSPISARAREIAGRVAGSGTAMSPRLAQDMLDGLTAAGLAEPMWPNFAGMGFKEDEAATIRDQLKSFELSRRTSIPGTERLVPEAKTLEALSAVVRALLEGRSPPLGKLPAVQAKVLQNAGRLGADEQLRQAANLLDFQLEHFITDSPSELLGVAPATVKAGLETSIAAQAHALKQATEGIELDSLTHDGFSAFGQLRELAVLDPVAAQKAGAAFVKELRAAEQRTGNRPLD